MDFMQLLDMILHVDKSLGIWIAQYGTLVYAVLFAIVFCETAFVIFPFCLAIRCCLLLGRSVQLVP